MVKKCSVCRRSIQIPNCLRKRKKFCSRKCFYLFKKGRHISPGTEIQKGQHLSKHTEFKKDQNAGEKHPLWKGGKRKMATGYIVIYAPGHPRAYRNSVYEHIVVAEKKIGRYLEKGETVHHINGVKEDNRPENLVVCSTHKEHMRNHMLKTWSRKYDRCISCKTTDIGHEGLGMCEKCYRRYRYYND